MQMTGRKASDPTQFEDVYVNDDHSLPVRVVYSDVTDGILDVFDQEIYNAAAGDGTLIAPAGLNRFTKWVFHIQGLTVDSVNIQVSLNNDGSNFDYVYLRDVGASVAAATITANGIYLPAFSSTNIVVPYLSFNSIRIGRSGTTDTVIVRAIGRV